VGCEATPGEEGQSPMIRSIALALICVVVGSACADELCLPKYKVITQQFEEYNQNAAMSNAVMDQIASYATKLNMNEVDPKSIHPDDAKRWRVAIEQFVIIGQHILQNMMEYKALGCSPDQQQQMQQMITKVTDDLRVSHARINSIESGLPTSTFR
jgi:hypothetical protein